MPELAILSQLAVIFAVAVAVVLLLGRIGIPTIAGMLLAGVLVGPNGLRLVHDVHAVELLAEVGVVLLLFTIGLEFSIERLRRIWQLVAIGGGLQVVLTTLATAAVMWAFGNTWQQAVLWGMLLSLSSTAIVLRALGERGEVDAPHGRLILGALIFQDLCVVPMMLIVPMLSGGEETSAMSLLKALGTAAGMVVAVVGIARLLVPRVLRTVASQRKRDLFMLTVLLICIGTAWITSLSGLSLALGAFLAGVVLAGSGYQHQAMSDMLPFRDSFTSLFFISVGMLLDASIFLERPVIVLMILLATLCGKFVIATLAALLMRFPLRVAMLSGIGLAQIGEFSFVLAKGGQAAGLVSPEDMRLFITASVMTMVLTPLLVRLGPHFAAGMSRLNPIEKALGTEGADQAHMHLEHHVIIAGFGLGGRTLAESLKALRLPYVVLDLNPVTVDRYRAQGQPIYYGDVTSHEVLSHFNCSQAREIVIVISDPAAARRAIAAVKDFDPNVQITVRTRYADEIAELKRLGANDVVVEEFENAVELMARVLRRFGIPRNVIAERIGAARHSREELVRPLAIPRQRLDQLSEILHEIKVEAYLIGPNDWAVNRSVREIDLRHTTGASVVAFRRDGKVAANPAPAERLLAGDIVYLLGDQASVTAAMQFFGTGNVPPPPETAEASPSEPQAPQSA